VLAYISWHRPAAGVEQSAYEQSLQHFHRSLAHRPPSGFRGSVSFRARELPWLTHGPGGCPGSATEDSVGGEASREERSAGYEDWYLLDGWSAVGVLEETAIARGHLTAHDAVAKLAGPATSAIYRLVEGHADLLGARVAVWVARKPGHESPTLADLLGDGMDSTSGGLWRRCIGLGPAPEFCLLANESPAGVATSRLPAGWSAATFQREAIFDG
jgi:hypothetical protein